MRAGLMCAGIIALATLVNQSAVHWRPNTADSDLFAYYGWCVLEGARPYLDVWDNKPPGIWWANAAAVAVCGPGIGADLLLGSTALLLTLAAFTGAAGTAYHRVVLIPAAILGTILLTNLHFECGANRTETLSVACESTAICGYVRWLRTRRLGWLVLAGLTAGAAPWFKQSGLAATAAIALHLAWVRWCTWPGSRRSAGPWLIFGGALACAPIIAVAVLAHQGALGAAAFAVTGFNRAYFAVGDASWLHLGHAVQAYWGLFELLGGMWALAAGGLLWAAGKTRRCERAPPCLPSRRTCLSASATEGRRHAPLPPEAAPRQPRRQSVVPPRRGRGVFVLWLLVAAYLALVSPGRRGHHFMPVLPPLGLLALRPLHLLAGRRGLRASLTARPSGFAVLMAYVYVLATAAVDPSNGTWCQFQRCWRNKPTWYVLRRVQPTDEELRAAEVRRLTAAHDTIYVWGWSPGTYRWSYRHAASRHATLEKLGQVGEHFRFALDAARADIQRNLPRLIFLSPQDYQGIVERPTAAAGEFGRWLSEHYELGPNIAGMYLLQRRPTVGDVEG